MELGEEVKKAVKGSDTSRDAQDRVEKVFYPPPIVWVKGNGDTQWRVFIRPFPGDSLHEFICDRF